MVELSFKTKFLFYPSMKKYIFIFLSLCFFISSNSLAHTLHVGIGQTYSNLHDAATEAKAGDIIIIHNGIYTEREDISNLNGEVDNPIIIYAAEEGKVIYSGQSEAWHLSSCSNLFIYGFVFENQTANGVNIDDSGNFDNSTFNITIKNCVFKDMHANGNNDMLKLSGLDDFTIENCLFENGSAGGSGIDMVGCHKGKIFKNSFDNMGSNCIQAKGGSQFITITQNNFKDGGMRTLNLGGSTGLAYFRPQDATFEAADIDVHSNVFIGSWSPIAFVGSVRVKVVNNTFYKPTNWVFRILQETVDTSRFLPCGKNEFSNNIIYFGNSLNRVVNIGPNTNPESFTISNNLWYDYQDDNFSGPNLPVEEPNAIIQQDPKFIDVDSYDFNLRNDSPAIAKGKTSTAPELDFKDKYYKEICSLGAFENNGIYKDFTGEIGTTWFYDFDSLGGFQTMKIVSKNIEYNQEISKIDHSVSLNDIYDNDATYNLFSNNDKVWYKSEDASNYSILYDFSLKRGDEIYTQLNYVPSISLIDSVKFSYIADKVRKILITSPTYLVDIGDDQYGFGNPGLIIEGIYSVNSFLLGNMKIDFFENPDSILFNSDRLRCFSYNDKDNTEKTIHFTDYPCDTLAVGINDIQILKDFTIFPNPIKNYINLDFREDISGNIKIFDLVGRKVYDKKVINQHSEKIKISGFQDGVYIIKISGKTFNSYQKVVVNKG